MNQRVLVKCYLSHVDEITDGALGPWMNLTYEWPFAGRQLEVGDIVLCPPTPQGPQHPHEGVVVSTDQEQLINRYGGPVKPLLALYARTGQRIKREPCHNCGELVPLIALHLDRDLNYLCKKPVLP